jgi:hypothetical protein
MKNRPYLCGWSDRHYQVSTPVRTNSAVPGDFTQSSCNTSAKPAFPVISRTPLQWGANSTVNCPYVIAYYATDVYIDIYQMHLRQRGHVFGG